jgi:hypothetical protein
MPPAIRSPSAKTLDPGEKTTRNHSAGARCGRQNDARGVTLALLKSPGPGTDC